VRRECTSNPFCYPFCSFWARDGIRAVRTRMVPRQIVDEWQRAFDWNGIKINRPSRGFWPEYSRRSRRRAPEKRDGRGGDIARTRVSDERGARPRRTARRTIEHRRISESSFGNPDDSELPAEYNYSTKRTVFWRRGRVAAGGFGEAELGCHPFLLDACILTDS